MKFDFGIEVLSNKITYMPPNTKIKTHIQKYTYISKQHSHAKNEN